VDKEEVQLRFDVLLNRMSLFRNGEFQEFVNSDPERAKVAQELDDTIRAAEPLIQRLDEPGVADRALTSLTPLEGKFARLASGANRFGADRVAEDQNELLRLHWLFTGLAGGLIICGFLLIVMLFWQNRALDRARSGLGELARDLEGKSTLLETTLDTIDEGLLMFDDSGKIQVFNRRALELLDLSSDFLQNATVQTLDRRQSDRGAIWQTPSEEHTSFKVQPPGKIRELILPDGRTIDVRDSQRAGGGVVRTYTDATARKAAELAKDTFLATMSHEIRTPLTGLLGMTELLAAEQNGGKDAMYVKSIQTSGQHLLAVVNDVLDFSRIGAGKLELEDVSFSAPALIESVRSIFLSQAQERGLALRVTVPEDLPIVRGDPTRLAQVLINLVGNALKFTEQGEISITVVQRADDNGRVKLRFEVRDTGVGIPPERGPELFDPFVQSDNSMARRYGGSGLGLAISKRLIGAMGGAIHFDSAPGFGSNFWFEVSLEPGLATLETNPPKAVAVPPLRIIVAEDVELNRDLLRAVLTGQRHDVLFACTGEEAVDLIADQQFDVVIMDVQMPLMDGVEATRRIRAMSGSKGRVPIIGLTANVVASDRERYLASGMNECLTKPIDWNELFAALARTLTTMRSSEALEADRALLNWQTVRDLASRLSREECNLFFERALDDVGKSLGRLSALRTNPTELARAAHSLKGTSAFFGFETISAIADEVEAAARDGSEVSGPVSRLVAAVSATRLEVTRVWTVDDTTPRFPDRPATPGSTSRALVGLQQS
jgi:signal transduction histidine kinase/DNA-binding response OmpR family regulator